jgi:hypothetical protein
VRKIAAAPIARVFVLRRFRETHCRTEPMNRFFVPSETSEQEAEGVCGYSFEQEKARTRLPSCLGLLFECLEDPFGQLDGHLRFGAGEDDKR